MSIRFLKIIDRVLSHEGGYTPGENDPGGETNWGISKRSYPNVDIKNLTRNQAIAIYHRDFWAPIHGDKMSDGAAYQLMDGAVNSGPREAIRFLQRAIGVADDGHFGPVSHAAMSKMSESDFIMLYVAERMEYMTKLKNWIHHGKGWIRRMAKNLRYGAVDS